MYKSCLVTIVIFHMLVVIGNFLAFFILPFIEDWYVALPLCSFIFWISCHKNGRCPMTVLENKVRLRMGKPEIHGFIKHYIVKPLVKIKNDYNSRL